MEEDEFGKYEHILASSIYELICKYTDANETLDGHEKLVANLRAIITVQAFVLSAHIDESAHSETIMGIANDLTAITREFNEEHRKAEAKEVTWH